MINKKTKPIGRPKWCIDFEGTLNILETDIEILSDLYRDLSDIYNEAVYETPIPMKGLKYCTQVESIKELANLVSKAGGIIENLTNALQNEIDENEED